MSSEEVNERIGELLSEVERLRRQLKEKEEELEEQQGQLQEKKQEDERLRKRREWLRSLSQEDRNFIAKYGEDLWRSKNEREKESS